MALILELPGQDAATRQDVVLLEHKIDLLREQLTASFRDELLAQSRGMYFAVVGALAVLGGTAFAIARLA